MAVTVPVVVARVAVAAERMEVEDWGRATTVAAVMVVEGKVAPAAAADVVAAASAVVRARAARAPAAAVNVVEAAAEVVRELFQGPKAAEATELAVLAVWAVWGRSAVAPESCGDGASIVLCWTFVGCLLVTQQPCPLH